MLFYLDFYQLLLCQDLFLRPLRWQIIGMSRIGTVSRGMAMALDLSRVTVLWILKKYRNIRQIHASKSTSRPRKTTERGDRSLLTIVRRGRRRSSRSLKNEWQQTLIGNNLRETTYLRVIENG